MRAPTPRQRRVLEYVRQYIALHQRPPTRAETAKHFHCRPNAIQGDLERLRAKGLVSWEKGKARTVVVCQ